MLQFSVARYLLAGASDLPTAIEVGSCEIETGNLLTLKPSFNSSPMTDPAGADILMLTLFGGILVLNVTIYSSTSRIHHGS